MIPFLNRSGSQLVMMLAWQSLFGTSLLPLGQEKGWFWTALERDAPIYVAVAVYIGFVTPFNDAAPAIWLDQFTGCLMTFLVACPLTAAVMRLHAYIVHLRPAHPFQQMVQEAAVVLHPAFVGRHVLMVLATALFAVGFTQFKAGIPGVAGGFTWDRRLAELDRWLHLGRHPWEWLQPLMGTPLVTFLTNVNYNLWFVLILGTFCAFMFKSAGAPGRTRFLLSFFLIWAIVGSLLAALMPSAGPCYFALVQPGDDPFSGLMTYLHEADAVFPVWALQTQDLLWAGHVSHAHDLGISAMPSVHNATALLLALAARDLHPRLRPWLIAHAAWVFLGSVHLGWHYAVDAYLSFLVTGLVWLSTTVFARRWDARFA